LHKGKSINDTKPVSAGRQESKNRKWFKIVIILKIKFLN
jgi:hypothetical protein